MTPAIIVRDPDILGGTPVFAGTRVTIKAIFDYLGAGDDLGDFPSVRREQALGLLELARERLTEADEAAA